MLYINLFATLTKRLVVFGSQLRANNHSAKLNNNNKMLDKRSNIHKYILIYISFDRAKYIKKNGK